MVIAKAYRIAMLASINGVPKGYYRRIIVKNYRDLVNVKMEHQGSKGGSEIIIGFKEC